MAYHFRVPGFRGGYIGVDLFFAISGYLIASIFLREPTVSLAQLTDFYGRRVKRLMPAFLVVAAFTVAVSSVLLLPDDFDALLRSVRESPAFRSNAFFEHETVGYFGADATEMPWLHTWSLSIEWQFYLVFPWVALALQRLPSPRVRIAALGGLVVVGVALSVAMVAHEPEQAYFSALARAFEFLIGAFAATIEPSVPATKRSIPITAAGVVSLFGLSALFTTDTPFPGIAALAVCLVGFVLLLTGRGGSVLSRAGLPVLGKRAYSIYLWHWPVVAWLNDLQHRASFVETAACLVVILVASEATYRWIEKPGIALSWRPRKAFVLCCVLPLACAATVYLFVRNHDGFPQRLGVESQYAYANLKRFDAVAADRCHDYGGSDFEHCAFGDLRGSTRALLIGDSHARHFAPFTRCSPARRTSSCTA